MRSCYNTRPKNFAPACGAKPLKNVLTETASFDTPSVTEPDCMSASTWSILSTVRMRSTTLRMVCTSGISSLTSGVLMAGSSSTALSMALRTSTGT